MSEYAKQTWVDGVTPIDAEHLNHIEEGIEANSTNKLNKAGFTANKYLGTDSAGNVIEKELNVDGTMEFEETGEPVVVYPVPHSKLDVVTIINGQDSAWVRAKEIVLRQVPKGGNLLDDVFTFGSAGTTLESNGLTAIINANRTVTVSGTNSSDGWTNICDQSFYRDMSSSEVRQFPAGTYTLPEGLRINYVTIPTLTSGQVNGKTFKVTEPFYISKIYISYGSGTTADKTIPIAMFSGETAPELDDYAFCGNVYKRTFTSAVTDGTYNWTTGELYDGDGSLVETLEVADIRALENSIVFFTGINANTNTVSGLMSIVNGSAEDAQAAIDCTDYNLPVLHLTGETYTMTKDNEVELAYVYGELSGTCTMKWQGTSSLAYDKKNYTIKFDNAFEAVEGWGEQKKYCLKANYIDFSHSRNVVSAKLWGQIVASRNTANETLAACPNYGAVDGFPICIVLNDEFLGVYTFNIPKDKWMMNMGEGTNECILCAGNSCDANLFKAEATLDGENDLEIEYITDENDTAWAVTSVNNLINACINSDGSDLDTTIASMLDWESAIDYYIFTVLLRGDDMVGKNYLLNTYDGTKWFFGAYDMDSTYGLHWNGGSFLPATTGTTVASSFAYMANAHRLFELIKTYKKVELKARYAELRAGVMSEDNVGMEFRNFAGQISRPLLDEDNRRWTSIPNTNCNNVQQILDWYRLRCIAIDAEINAIEV